MDPQLLLMLLPMLMQMDQSGGSTGPGVGGPVDPNTFNDILNTVSPGLFSTVQPTGPESGIAGLQGLLGGNFNPANLIALFGGQFGSMLGNLLGITGVPRDLKTEEVGGALAKSGDPIAQMLSQFVGRNILGKGDVLSSPGGSTAFREMAQVLEWLSGNSLPGLSKGVETLGGVGGIPVPRDISRLNEKLGMSPNLDPGEIASFLPQIENIVAGGGANLKNITGQIEALINSVSGQQQAAKSSGRTTPGGTGGNSLLAAFGGGGGGKGFDMKQILDRLRSMVSPESASGNLVGATA